MYYNDEYFTTNVRLGYQISREIANGRWYETIKTNAKYPKLTQFPSTKNTRPSDLWVADRSFLKVRNIQLGYTLPKRFLSSAGLKTFRLYCSLENFFSFTKFPGIDQEVMGISGVSGLNYPPMKQFVFGANLSF